MARTSRNDIDIDWITIILYLILVVVGWLNIYSATENAGEIFDLSQNYGRQMVFILVSLGIGIFIMFLDTKFIEFLSWPIYGIALALLIATFFFAPEVKGEKNWIEVAGIKLQAAEFAKVGVVLALSKLMSRINFSFNNPSDLILAVMIVLVPMAVTLGLLKDEGSALVFMSLIFLFYRMGLHPLFLILGICMVAVVATTLIVPDQVWLTTGIVAITGMAFMLISKNYWQGLHIPLFLLMLGGVLIYNYVDGGEMMVSTVQLAAIILITLGGILAMYFIFRSKFFLTQILMIFLFSSVSLSLDYGIENFLEPHQQLRIKALLNPNEDPLGYGWNVTRSKMAIGSGGVWGKGFTQGTQTQGGYVPEQHTDFIFCTIGEEHGWMGTSLTVILFFVFLARLVYLAENAKSDFARVFGYGLVSILFIHIAVNIAMTIGLGPVIGIPLPFISYGGSSLIVFSAMVFILLNHYSYRVNVLSQ